MDSKNQNLPKKCFCARCFLPIEETDKVEVEGQNFHRMCSTCCICRTIPAQLKMFYGHVFCNECFKTHVLCRFKDNPHTHTESWWMQFAPGVKPQEMSEKGPKFTPAASEVPDTKRCICSRCLQAVEKTDLIEIDGQAFHVCCARCCACHQVPRTNIKIYYGQAFCEDCFNRLILNRNKDNPTEFFKNCFEQWQNNPQFIEYMRNFMSSNTSTASNTPFVFMQQGNLGRCSPGRTEVPPAADWFRNAEPKKSATPPTVSLADSSRDLSFEYRTDSERPESYHSTKDIVPATEKIEKLTKYLRARGSNTEIPKKWKKYNNFSLASDDMELEFTDVRSAKVSKLNCPKCLWQCGTIYVDRGFVQRKVCVENFC